MTLRYCPSHMDRKSDRGILATIQKCEEGADQRDGPRFKDLENSNHQSSVCCSIIYALI